MVAAAAPAQADQDPVTVRWDAPAGCPDRATLVAAVEAHLSGPLTAPGRVALAVELDATMSDGLWRLRLRTRSTGGDGERELAGTSCAQVVAAAALVLALAIDPDAVARAAAPAPAGAAPARRPAWRAAMAVGAAADAGTVPGGGVGLEVALAVSRGRLRVELDGSLWPARRAPLPSDPGQGGDIGLVAAALRGCAGTAVEVCAGLELGRLRGRGYGLSDPELGSARWSALSLVAGRSWRVSRFLAIRAQAELLVGLERPRFVIPGAGEVYRPGALAGRVLIGPELVFW